ncbi:hypothetical protein [Mycetocola zhadangensis]|uniref:Uncharacterized protein n=1 Tax=Mycetocola zhadangensis TaxID=1164595 RepID=A0A3L7J7R6_9MICO|nr:hypothetical protein [Mycetocola zhadangensis]RLQ85491.1 hypothetical protein D9V28_00935 [Mycetocola zhadangensis]GGE83074.1 hypothetical protein GCM10011313_01850 [Mycetocola zhadangensis]
MVDPKGIKGEHDNEPVVKSADPPFQVLFPNLDRVSRESFRPGTVSRRRINRALGFFAVVALIVVALVWFTDVLFGPGGLLR